MVDDVFVGRVVAKCAEEGLDATLCGRKILARVCGLTDHQARAVVMALRTQVPTNLSREPALSETHDRTDATWTISLPKTRIKTLDELIKHCQIDVGVWEVERWVCNKWEVASSPKATKKDEHSSWVRPSAEMVVEPLFQIKVWLVRRDVRRLQGPDSKIEFLKQFREIIAGEKFKFQTKPGRVPRPAEADHDEIAVVACSDLHLTETVRPDDANGVNVYGSVIGANRLWEHAQKVISIVRRHMSLYEIKKIWSPLLGDVLNGTIHEEYVATNDLSDPAAVVLGARLLHMFYSELKSIGLPIEIDAIHGNHARLTPKVPTKRQARTNLDWLCYEMLSDAFKGDDQVALSITTSQIGTKRLYDWNYVFEHGIDVKNGKEEDFEDRVRALFDDPTFREATGYRGSAFDQIVIGNMHKPKFLERTVVNGSYIGQNELGQSWRLKPIRAQQLMWGVSQRHVRTWQYAVDLTHVKTAEATNPFSEYAAWFMKKHGQ